MPTISVDDVLNVALIGINRALVFMGLGVSAATDPTHRNFRLKGSPHVQLLPANISDDSVNEFKREFRVWVIGNGLRELVETWDVLLDKLYSVLLSATWWKTTDRSDQANARAYEKRDARFRKLGTSGKLEVLRKEFLVGLEFGTEIESIKRARNCLVHRLGVVGPEDIGDGGTLEVTWRMMELYGYEKDGSEFVPSLDSFPIEFPVDSPVKLRHRVNAKSLLMGESLEFSEVEVTEICYTFRLAVDQARSALVEAFERMGVQVNQTTGGVAEADVQAGGA